MRLLLASLFLFALSLFSPAHAETVTLRDHAAVAGASITIGDVFENAGPLASRVIAPAPAPGQTMTLPGAVVAAAASASGLDWTPPQNFQGVTVTRGTDPRSSGIRATLRSSAPQLAGAQSGGVQGGEEAQLTNVSAINTAPVANAAVHRGEAALIVYALPGMTLSARARALEDGAAGQDIRFLNLTSNRIIDAVVTGPGAAQAAPMQ
jgi:flagella basal body P-ring formation protein FlgA